MTPTAKLESALGKMLGAAIALAASAGLAASVTDYGFWRLYALAWAAEIVIAVGAGAGTP